jgi:hypothetical protein
MPIMAVTPDSDSNELEAAVVALKSQTSLKFSDLG